MSKITNTADNEQHPEWLMGGNPDAIESQEARGQEELVNADVLPTSIASYAEPRKVLEDAGVVFGEEVKNDALFTNVGLPHGWKKHATDHSMHSELIDELGRVRAYIFYKAAFYDRRADMSIRSLEEVEKEK